MPPCKRPRTFPPERDIPFDLVLEIVARCDDVATVIRFAATCRTLRCDILRPDFLHRIFHDHGHAAAPPSCVLSFLHAYDDSRGSPRPPAPYSLAHPATPGAARFAGQLARFVSRSAAVLLDHYDPVASSRNGLVVLYRRYISRRRRPEICVYDPMTGGRAFFPRPPGIRQGSRKGIDHTYVLLTAADGIGCSFLLLVADFAGLKDRSSESVEVHTVSSDAARRKWSSATAATASHRALPPSLPRPHCSAVVLGGIIHWMMYRVDHGRGFVLTYDVRTATAGTIELPTDGLPNICKLCLASSPDGKLSLLVGELKLRISVWLLRPDGAGWSRHAVIDTKATVKSLLLPDMPPEWWLGEVVEFGSSGGRSGAILVQPFKDDFNDVPQEEGDGLVVLDMETKEMRRAKREKHVMAFPFEIDLKLRLSAMKTF